MPKGTRLLIRTILLSSLLVTVWASAGLGLDRTPQETAFCAGPSETLVDLFRKQPYLILPSDPSQMEVLWQLTATAASTIAWGPDTTCSLGSAQTTEYGADHQHSYTITDLAQRAHYHFKVTVDEATYRGSFTAAPDTTATDLKFFAYGDTRSNPYPHDQVAAAMLSQISADSTWQTFALLVGDLVNTGSSETDWTTQFFTPLYTHIRGAMAALPYESCMGNHEGNGVLFVKYFPYPFVAARYWSFDYGPAHFLVMDQYTNYAPGSAQLQWITDDLAASSKLWKFICLHEPGWSAGGSHVNNTSVQQYIQPLCEEYGVSIVFGGHNHYYARAVVNGVQHITTGGGGAPLYQPDPTYPYVVASAPAYHHCQVEINGSALSFRALKPDGTLLDIFTLQASTGVAEPGPRGDLMAAYPNPFRTDTVIDWRAAGDEGAQLVIIDVSGRVVRRFAADGPGIQSAHWDGTDTDGRPVASGVYFYRIEPSSTPARDGRLLLIR